MTETRIYQADIDAFKKERGLCPESLSELYKQNRMIDLISNGKALAGIIERFRSGDFVSAVDGVEIQI